MRQFIRHPAAIPIEVIADDSLTCMTQTAFNVSVGGLAIRSDHHLAEDCVVEVRIAFVRPVFNSKARVVWCNARENDFEIGVEFLDPQDAYRARMVEQVCHIHTYRQVVLETEGRDLTDEEAAIEWIGKYAAGFPDSDPEEVH